MRVLSGIFILLFTLGGIFAQEERSIISRFDSVLLVNMPEMDAIPILKSTDLPYKLDNSVLPYFRPIYEQVSNECSQVSAIAYNFTYEMNRLRDLPSDDSANQYPTHFVYNFGQDGNGWTGVSYFQSFESLKQFPRLLSRMSFHVR